MVDVACATRVLEAIREAAPERFYMPNWRADDADCGTVGCVAGWVTILEGMSRSQANQIKRVAGNDYNSNAFYIGKEKLDLDAGDAVKLFSGHNNRGVFLSDLTHAHGLAVLKHLIETGEVDWDAAIDNVKAQQEQARLEAVLMVERADAAISTLQVTSLPEVPTTAQAAPPLRKKNGE